MKLKLIKSLIIPVVVIGFIVFILIYTKIQDTELKKNPEYGLAVIVRTYVGAKAKDYVKYEFVVAGKVYDGDQGYMPHRERINVGDTCEVVYAKTNPEISRLLTDENDLLIVKRAKHRLKFY